MAGAVHAAPETVCVAAYRYGIEPVAYTAFVAGDPPVRVGAV
jgi:hypothetical protein